MTHPELIFVLVQFIETTPAWVILTIGFSFILVDIFITSDSYLMLVGLALMLVGCLNALDVSGDIQIASFPVLLIINLLFVRKFFLKMSFNKREGVGADNILGKTGKVIFVDEESRANGKAFIQDYGEWGIRSKNNQNLNAGDKVKVVEREDLTLVVVRVKP